nr:AMP-binding protein [Chromobacterium sp. ASV5]
MADADFRGLFAGFRACDAPAYLHPDGDLSYDQLFRGALALALRLAACAPRGQLLLVGERGRRSQIAWWASLLAGWTLFPLAGDTPPARLRQVAASAARPLWLWSEAGPPPQDAPWLAWPEAETDEARLAAQWNALLRLPAADPEDIAYQMFSSGTTGQPKGIAVRYRNLAGFVDWMRRLDAEWGGAGVVSGMVRPCFDVSLFEMWLAWLGRQAQSALAARDFHNTRRYLERFAEHGLRAWVSTPSQAHAYLADPRFNARTLPGLRVFLFCGETLSKPLLAALWQRFPAARVFNSYGPTECAVAVSCAELTPADLASPLPLSVGRARPGATLSLRPLPGLPPGRGEIVIGGEAVGAGYPGQPELSAARFRDGGYLSGDIGSVGEDGRFYFWGRQDRECKVLGARVDLNEVERHLQSLPGVGEAVVEPYQLRGQTRGLRAWLRGPDAAALPALAALAAEELPRHLLPRFWHALSQPALNRNGKLDRQALIDHPLHHADYVYAPDTFPA